MKSRPRGPALALTQLPVEGENPAAVRADHSKMTELFLGGIIRSVLLVEKR